jgi:prepilin peptidase CpaA
MDVRARRIPNAVPLVLAGGWIALALAGWVRGADPHALSHLAAGAGLFVLAMLAWRARVMGGGDVKLLGAVGLWLPLSAVPGFLIALSLAGGVQALASLAMRRFRASGKDPHRMPYAVSITVAAACVLLGAS